MKIEGIDSGDFGIEGNNCNGFIGPNMVCELLLRFSPSSSGARQALLRVITDGSPSEYVTELSGEGTAPELTFEPGSYDFGLVERHSNGPRTSFTVRNTGAASVTLSSLEISGPDTNEFQITNSNCRGATLSAGATCSVEVQFNANEEGSASAAVSISAGGVTFRAPLTGSAANPRVEASPAQLAFGATTVGSVQVKEVTLTNTGQLPVAFFISLVSGGDIASFHLIEENCTSKVFAGQPRIFEPGESCTAKVAFEPTTVGAKDATISFFGAGEGALQVSVEGTAVAPLLSLAPGSRDFGSVPVGTAGPVQVFTLNNESSAPQAIDSATLAGPDLGEFQIRSDECSDAVLEPGGSCAVAVRFAPGSSGAKSATLRLRGPGIGTAADLTAEGAPAPAPPVMTTAVGGATRGHVGLDLKLRPRPASGKVTIGSAHCASTEPCVLKLNGYVSGQVGAGPGRRAAVHNLRPSQLLLAPGATVPITMSLPQDFRASSGSTSLRVSLRWETGTERGATDRGFRLAAGNRISGR